MQSHSVVQLHNPTTSSRRSATQATLAARQTRLQAALTMLGNQADVIDQAAEQITVALRSGSRVLVAGNGGSAAEAQHFATELVGRFKRERSPYAVLSLTADTAILTAIANDYGFERVFERQVNAYGGPGDILVTFSTSGESENLILAAIAAARKGMYVLAITGERESRLSHVADITLRMPSTDTQLVQELHTITLHLLCDLIESALCTRPNGKHR